MSGQGAGSQEVTALEAEAKREISVASRPACFFLWTILAPVGKVWRVRGCSEGITVGAGRAAMLPR